MEAHLDHLPGRDERAEPGEADRGPDRGADRHPRQGGQGGGDEARRGAPRARRDPSRSAAGLPARVLRRHAAARNDRDGPRVQSEDRHRGRARDGVGRHDPGADPRAARAAAEGAPPVDDPDLPRPQRHGGDVREGRDHVWGQNDGGRKDGRRVHGSEASVHPGTRRGLPRYPGPADDASLHPRGRPQPDQSAVRLRLPSAMQVRVRPVHRRRACARGGHARTTGRVLPVPRGPGGDATPDDGGSPLIRVRDLKVWFPLRRGMLRELTGRSSLWVRAVDGVSFDVKRGEIFCLVGESGCGKTTTGKALLRLNAPTGGNIFFDLPDDGWNRLGAFEARLAALYPHASALSPGEIRKAYADWARVQGLTNQVESTRHPRGSAGRVVRRERYEKTIAFLNEREQGLRDWADAMIKRLTSKERNKLEVAQTLGPWFK